MDVISKVKELSELASRLGLTALKWKEGDTSIEVRKDVKQSPVLFSGAQTDFSQTYTPTTFEKQGVPVLSPMTGIFYRKPTPSEPPFVNEGDTITAGQVIGVIEAMKVFNEVESTQSGIVLRFAVEDGGMIQEGEPILFVSP